MKPLLLVGLISFVALPLALFAVLLFIANRRASQQTDDDVDEGE